MIINHNIAALNTYRQLGSVNNNTSKSLEKLSSGMRINKAADDAAGLAISEKMRSQIRGLEQASRNAQDGISLIQTAEGSLQETENILQRMRELGVQASSDTLDTEDRTAIATELSELNDEIDRIADTTSFNGKNLLDGTLGVQLDTSGLAEGSDGVVSIDISGADASTTYTITDGSGSIANGVTLSDGSGNTQTVALADGTAGTLNFDKLGIKVTVNDTWDVTTLAATVNGGGAAGTVITTASSSAQLQIGAGTASADSLAISISKMDTSASSLNTTGIDVSSHTTSQAAVDSIDTAIQAVSDQRAELGAWQNRLEHTINNLGTASENLTAAESRVRDTDMAKEMMNFTKNNIISQAATSMLAQANQQPQQVLSLLR